MGVVNILVSLEISPGAADSAQVDLAAFHEASKKSPGFLYMYIMRDSDSPAQIFIVEAWESQQDFETHITSEHFLAFGKVIPEIITSMSIKTLLPFDYSPT